jgi:hypothetical protein
MLNPYPFEEILRTEQELLDQRNLRRARWHEREPRPAPFALMGGARRRLARLLLVLADRLDPRAVVSMPHVPASPALNGTPRHA